jgi:DnaJ-class molecular chaperone
MHDGWEQFKEYELGEVVYRAKLKILHEDCGWTCGQCSGSGEGMADGTTCRECKGSGFIKRGPDREMEFEVRWDQDDLKDLEYEDGDPVECEFCGHNFWEDITEELKWLRKHGKSS